MDEAPTTRDAAQILFIGLKLQAETLLALLRAGALAPEAVRATVFSISTVTGAWARWFPEGPGMFGATLAELENRVGIA